MVIEKQTELYSGKAKTIFATTNPEYLVLHFRDDISAFNGVKLEKLANKGAINNQFNAFVMKKLQENHIPVHFEKVLSPNESLVKKLDMIPVECVVRNITAGNLCKRLGIPEGQELNPPLFELYLKSDALGDPMITPEHVRAFRWATDEELAQMRNLTFQVNAVLQPMFLEAGMLLVDYKLEFGRFRGEVVLGDEFSPDGCRIWDAQTKEVLDKDRFRKDLGQVTEAYEAVAQRLGIVIHKEKAIL